MACSRKHRGLIRCMCFHVQAFVYDAVQASKSGTARTSHIHLVLASTRDPFPADTSLAGRVRANRFQNSEHTLEQQASAAGTGLHTFADLACSPHAACVRLLAQGHTPWRTSGGISPRLLLSQEVRAVLCKPKQQQATPAAETFTFKLCCMHCAHTTKPAGALLRPA